MLGTLQLMQHLTTLLQHTHTQRPYVSNTLIRRSPHIIGHTFLFIVGMWRPCDDHA
jgi:hypothetical protein